MLAILVFGVVLRWHGIAGFSFWDDELFSVVIAGQTAPWWHGAEHKALTDAVLADGFWTWKLADQSPPLYEMLLAAWIRLWGMGEGAVRSLSALLSVGAMLSAWALPRSVPPLARTAYLLLLATCGVLLVESQDARCYSLLACCNAWMMVLLWRQMAAASDDTGRFQGGSLAGRWPPAAAVVLGAALCLTHYYAALHVGATAAVTVAMARGWRARVRAALRWALAFVPLAIYLVPAWHGVAAKIGAAAGIRRSFAMAARGNLLDLLGALLPQPTLRQMWLAVLGLLILACAWWRGSRGGSRSPLPTTGSTALSLGGVTATLSRPMAMVAAVALVDMVLLALGTRRIEFFHPRYMVPLLPSVLLMLAVSLALPGKSARLVAACMVAVLVPGGIALWNQSPRPQNWGDWRGAAAALRANWRPGDAVVMPAAKSSAELQRFYLRDVFAQGGGRDITVPLQGREAQAYAVDRIAALQPLPPRIFVYGHLSGLHTLQEVSNALEAHFGCSKPIRAHTGMIWVVQLDCDIPSMPGVSRKASASRVVQGAGALSIQ